MDMLFDGSRLFGKKIDSPVERFKDSRAKVCSFGLSDPVRQFHQQFFPLHGYGSGYRTINIS